MEEPPLHSSPVSDFPTLDLHDLDLPTEDIDMDRLHTSPMLDFPTLDLHDLDQNQCSHGFHPLWTGHGSTRFADQMSHGVRPPMGEPLLHSSPVSDFPTLDLHDFD